MVSHNQKSHNSNLTIYHLENKKGDFGLINTTEASFFLDPNLSGNAKVLGIWLSIHKSNKFNINRSYLRAKTGLTDSALTRAMNQLIDTGYLVRNKFRDEESGGFSVQYKFFISLKLNPDYKKKKVNSPCSKTNTAITENEHRPCSKTNTAHVQNETFTVTENEQYNKHNINKLKNIKENKLTIRENLSIEEVKKENENETKKGQVKSENLTSISDSENANVPLYVNSKKLKDKLIQLGFNEKVADLLISKNKNREIETELDLLPRRQYKSVTGFLFGAISARLSGNPWEIEDNGKQNKNQEQENNQNEFSKTSTRHLTIESNDNWLNSSAPAAEEKQSVDQDHQEDQKPEERIKTLEEIEEENLQNYLRAKANSKLNPMEKPASEPPRQIDLQKFWEISCRNWANCSPNIRNRDDEVGKMLTEMAYDQSFVLLKKFGQDVKDFVPEFFVKELITKYVRSPKLRTKAHLSNESLIDIAMSKVFA